MIRSHNDAGLAVVAGRSARLVLLGGVDGEPFERLGLIETVGAVRQQVLVLGVGHEEQPEQDHHDLLVGVRQLLTRWVGCDAPRGGSSQRRDGLEVHPVAQPCPPDPQRNGWIRRESPRCFRPRRERPRRTADAGTRTRCCSSKARLASTNVSARPFATHTGIRARRVEPNLRSAGEQRPVDLRGGLRRRERATPATTRRSVALQRRKAPTRRRTPPQPGPCR